MSKQPTHCIGLGTVSPRTKAQNKPHADTRNEAKLASTVHCSRNSVVIDICATCMKMADTHNHPSSAAVGVTNVCNLNMDTDARRKPQTWKLLMINNLWCFVRFSALAHVNAQAVATAADNANTTPWVCSATAAAVPPAVFVNETRSTPRRQDAMHVACLAVKGSPRNMFDKVPLMTG